MKRYNQGFWKVDYPSEWNIETEEDAPVTFYKGDSDWAIQVSHYYKEAGEVNDNDLQEFIEDLNKHGSQKKQVITPHCHGLIVEFKDDENIIWKHILLRSGHVMLYITYNWDIAGLQLDSAIFKRFIDAIKIIGEQGNQGDGE